MSLTPGAIERMFPQDLVDFPPVPDSVNKSITFLAAGVSNA